MTKPSMQTLYCPQLEHDNCGIGAVVDIHGRKTHQIVADALHIVENLEHRAGKDAQGKTGDGVGILVQISHRFSPKYVPNWALLWAGSGNTALACSSFPRMN